MCYRNELTTMLEAVDNLRDTLLGLQHYLPYQNGHHDYVEGAADTEQKLRDMLSFPWEYIWSKVDDEDEDEMDPTDTTGLPRRLPEYFTHDGNNAAPSELNTLNEEIRKLGKGLTREFMWAKYSAVRRIVATNPATRLATGQVEA